MNAERRVTADGGTIAATEHEVAYAAYVKRFSASQSSERIAERGGFSYAELTDLLGHEPKTWRPR